MPGEMASSPPSSPPAGSQRPMSAMIRPPRSSSRMSVSSKYGGNSRASDEDGKTSVRVAVRIRPPLKASDPGFELIPQRFQRSMVQVTSPTSLAVDSPQGRKLFVFDRVFGPDVEQEGVWEYLNESVHAFVQGYNVSLLAYGQSGSGKSYTMGTSGPVEQSDPMIMGVIPRAAGVLFDKLNGGDARGSASGIRAPTRYSIASPHGLSKRADKQWTMKATYVEIYNEQLRDLLLPESVPQHERSAVTIREDTKGHILLTGLHQVAINSIEDLLGALNFGSSIRQTDATAINAKSSRSHAVFSLNLVSRKNKTQSTVQEKRRSVPIEAMSGSDNWVTVDSKLHFVDLAGSERMKNTGAYGDRAKEGISINAGLASLGKVISQLSSRHAGSHVSYRDSKLTRLLQDSLGGNAITYMVACVTPAEFHLSETLNTVQYAQRARAIQSKPQIQQVADESDKQALIERLRAEVAFLRDQIRNTERAERKINAPQERAERQNEREMDLQNELLNIQENYTALSQRHTRLISEISKARDKEDHPITELPDGQLGDSAVERMKRSNSFAEAVQQVLLEYEKTIESLESSLSSTRSTLSTTESNLLEKETKCAYVETMNQQLQTRLHKLMDRESSTESYLGELEAKLDGHTSGEEKNAAIVIELRKEISRVRENEASCEDYISTLEERLAEADQDQELMQREVDRLEHVIERQRSLGKLDNLLYELDHVQNAKKSDGAGGQRDEGSKGSTPRLSGHQLRKSVNGHLDTGGVEGSEKDGDERQSNATQRQTRFIDSSDESDEEKESTIQATSEKDFPQQSPAQSKFVADKLENVTQELFDLRMEHETTVNEFDLLSSKYEQALRTLSELQDAVDEARHPNTREVFATPASTPADTRRSSFLDGAATEQQHGGPQSSSRSLSSELLSAGELPATSETSEASNAGQKPETDPVGDGLQDDDLVQELEYLKRLQVEKENAFDALSEQYSQLHDRHQETLDIVEELKTEVQKAKANPSSPTTPVIRRKSSQNIMIIDRAHRSFASLRNIATENFDDKPDIMQSFELNLKSAMHELYSRSERVQELEAEITNVRKEMETKMTIISGLTRERSSLNSSSGMDISIVSTMRDQLMRTESQIKSLHEQHAKKENALYVQIEELQDTLERSKTPLEKQAHNVASEHPERAEAQERRIVELQDELARWEDRHQSAVDSMQASEKQLLDTISDLESTMGNVEALRAQSTKDRDNEQSVARSDLDVIKAQYDDVVKDLESKIGQHTASVNTYAERISELEQSNAHARGELEEGNISRAAAEQQLDEHRELIGKLEAQIAQHQSAVESHQDELEDLQRNYSAQLEELKASHHVQTESQLTEQAAKHTDMINSLHAELTEAKDEMGRLLQGVATVLHEETSPSKLQQQVVALVEHKAESTIRYDSVKEASEKLSTDNESLKTSLAELTRKHESSAREIEKLNEQCKRSARIVEELEEQLSANFDQHQDARSRFSVLETERSHRIEEALATKTQALADLDSAKEEIARLESKIFELQPNGLLSEGRPRSGSVSSNLRKSASHTSLPSPPPAIPLPPLPNNASAAVGSGHPGPGPPTPTGSRHPSKELASNQFAEDQEARIRTIEKHLLAEKSLTATLEQALVELETQGKKVKEDLDSWKKKAWAYEDEVESLKKNQKQNRYSMQRVEEERNARKEAEAARAKLEERMNTINKKKKKNPLNCF
ncbi:MAG: hypothetical protein M1833_000877 [Piccolia ochrophora]|nr:MAG: hypothetical protein M1833_000877 [Piccolia ochrophora]